MNPSETPNSSSKSKKVQKQTNARGKCKKNVKKVKVNSGKQYNYKCKITNLIKVKETKRVKHPCNCIKKML